MFKKIQKLFNKKTELEKELEIEEEIINDNVEQKPTAIIIKYFIEDEETPPKIIKICNFHNEIMPDINSIIWAPNEANTMLVPYKVIRFDFIEDENETLRTFTYIVVSDARYSDIITN